MVGQGSQADGHRHGIAEEERPRQKQHVGERRDSTRATAQATYSALTVTKFIYEEMVNDVLRQLTLVESMASRTCPLPVLQCLCKHLKCRLTHPYDWHTSHASRAKPTSEADNITASYQRCLDKSAHPPTTSNFTPTQRRDGELG